MFLDELNKDQGIAFINLVTEFALSDDRIGKEEERIMEEFCLELKLSEEEIVDMDIDKVFETIKASSERTINIVYFELMRVGLADDAYEFSEVDFLQKVGDELKIPRAKRIAFVNYFYKFSDAEPKNIEEAKREAEKLM